MVSVSELVFFVNGKKVTETAPDPSCTLLTFLRLKLGLSGTKLGCGEGGCGACTVMVSRYDRREKRLEHLSVNSCLAPLVSMHGLAVTTVEGIGGAGGRLHAVQQRLAASHGSQCGFCTPGIVMSMYTLLRNNPKPEMEDIDTYFQGNLCRCTGYRPILEGMRTFTESWAATSLPPQTGGLGGCAMGDNCCKNQKSSSYEDGFSPALYSVSSFLPYSPSQEPIFPPELKLDSLGLDSQDLVFRGRRLTWYRPTSLEQLLILKQEHPKAKLVVGNTELGVEVKLKHQDYPVYVCPGSVPELTQVVVDEAGLRVGAAVTLTSLEKACLGLVASLPGWKTRVFQQILEMLRWFAGKQIRNVAAIGGNIMTGSPISDINPILMAAGCSLQVASVADKRQLPFDKNFYTGYRKNVLKPSEVLISVVIPFTQENQFFLAYKQAKRRDDDIAIVNAAFNLTIANYKVESITMAFGGMAPVTKLGLKTTAALAGQSWNRDLVSLACGQLAEEFKLPPDVPGAMARYRQSLVLSFFFKFFLNVDNELNGGLDTREVSATEVFTKAAISSGQLYEVKPVPGPEGTSVVGAPLQHRAAEKQAAGTALYIDDMPRLEGELYLAFVLSSRAHATLTRVDPGPALTMDGVEDWLDHTTISQEKNLHCSSYVRDELMFAVGKVHCHGQVIGAVVAKDQDTAQRAARAVVVEYKDLPAIITIEDAIAANSYYDNSDRNTMECGDISAAFATAEHIVEGSVRTGAQEQFYLETQVSLVIPGEGEEVEVWASTQSPAGTQKVVADVLGVGAHKVVVRVKRAGGGFGGKESRSMAITAAVAVAARKTGKPVRCMLDREEDMVMTGARNPFLGRYKVAFNSQGLVQGLQVDLYNNSGWTQDVSCNVMTRAMFHSDGVYKVPNMRVRGYCCQTNTASNTAFRGYGLPQAVMIAEGWVEAIAERLGLALEEVRFRNLYKEGQLTHFNQVLEDCTVNRCWEECSRMAAFPRVQEQVVDFNAANRWKKRGVAMTPVKLGIGFSATYLNQGSCLLNVYTDGTVLLSYGGMEMGQGLHTKMIQVCAHTLGIPHAMVHISDTSTDKVPNAPSTAASVSSDLHGGAVLQAANTIKARLSKYKNNNPGGSWKSWVEAAFIDRISLSATGFYCPPEMDYSFKTNSGKQYNYFCFGVGCSLVEVDCLTGDHQILRTDLMMDVGESLNPAVDIGQIEGGFLQGYGMLTMEQLLHSPEGRLLTRGPGAYKIPSFNDVPAQFHTGLLRGSSNPRAVYSSKAVGEPALGLASSVYYAIKGAVRSSRQDAGASSTFILEIPATAERIRMACVDRFVESVAPLPEEGSYRPWAIQI